MYKSPDIAKRIKELAKEKGIVLKDMLVDLDIGSNSMSAMYHGRMPAADTLARIADYLDSSVDYLMGRTEKQPSERELSNGRIQYDLTPRERDLIIAYRINPAMRPAVDRVLDLPPLQEKKEA